MVSARFCFYFLEMSLLSGIFVPLPFSLLYGAFLRCDHGLDFLYQFTWEFNQSINKTFGKLRTNVFFRTSLLFPTYRRNISQTMFQSIKTLKNVINAYCEWLNRIRLVVYVWSSHMARVRINRVRLPILFVISRTGKIIFSLSSFAPEILVSRDNFGSPVPRRPAHLQTQAEPSGYSRDSYRIPWRRPFRYLKRHAPSGQSRVYRVT